MLTKLRQLHAEMFEALAASEALTRGPVPDRQELAKVRWNLTRAGINLRLFQEVEICPLLLRMLPAEDAAAVRDIRDSGRELRNAASEHIVAWPIDRAACEWASFCEDSRLLRQNLRRHVGIEMAVLYPMLLRCDDISDGDAPQSMVA